jgi:hypothetical protein
LIVNQVAQENGKPTPILSVYRAIERYLYADRKLDEAIHRRTAAMLRLDTEVAESNAKALEAATLLSHLVPGTRSFRLLHDDGSRKCIVTIFGRNDLPPAVNVEMLPESYDLEWPKEVSEPVVVVADAATDSECDDDDDEPMGDLADDDDDCEGECGGLCDDCLRLDDVITLAPGAGPVS